MTSVPGRLPLPERFPRKAADQGVLRAVGLLLLVAGAVAVAWLAWGSAGWPADARWSLGAGAIAASLAGAWLAARRASIECLVHENGVALAAAGRILGRIFWQDMVNLLEDEDDGRIRIYAHQQWLEIRVPGFERAEELRSAIRTQWNNLWGYKVATFPDIGFYYAPSALDEAKKRLRAATAVLGLGAIALAAGIAGVAAAALGDGPGPWGSALAAVGAGGAAVGWAFRERAALRPRWARMTEVGGIQIGDRGLRVFSRTGELRELPFAEVAALSAPEQGEIVLRMRDGERHTLHCELAYFEKFREALLDASREQGVREGE